MGMLSYIACCTVNGPIELSKVRKNKSANRVAISHFSIEYMFSTLEKHKAGIS